MEDTRNFIIACTALVSAILGPVISIIIIKIQNKNSKQVAFFNNVGQMRQEWINKLREKIAEVLNLAHQAYIGGIDSIYSEEKTEEFYKRLLFLHREIQLMLNPIEEKHIELEKNINKICHDFNNLDNLSSEFTDLIKLTTSLAQSIFKEEWTRIKKGD